MAHDDPELPLLSEVELQGYTLDVDFFLKKDYDDIGSASQELPALAEWINMMVQYYAEERIIAKHEIKEAEAKAYFRISSDGEFTVDGVTTLIAKKTEALVARAVDIDPDVMKAHRRYARLSGWVTRLQNLQLSFQSKLDLVRSTESTRRAVFTNEPPEE